MKICKKKGFLALALLLCLSLALPPAARAADTPAYAYVATQSVYFYDVDTKYPWAFHEIDYLAAANILQGSEDFLFEPEKPISRADFVLMLYRAYDMKGFASGEYFKDVNPGDYYADAVLAARSLGIATGENGYFRPRDSITREDAMVMLERTLSRAGVKLATGSLNGYADMQQVAGYAAASVSKLARAGIISGNEKNRLEPRHIVTRAEMAVLLYRALMVEVSGDGPHYKAHPERINLCIGDKVYSGATVANYKPDQTYAGLMEYSDFQQTETGHSVVLGAPREIDQDIYYHNGVLRVNGKQVTIAPGCVAVQLAPYSVIKGGLQTTGETRAYKHGMASLNDKGEAEAVYYMK